MSDGDSVLLEGGRGFGCLWRRLVGLAQCMICVSISEGSRLLLSRLSFRNTTRMWLYDAFLFRRAVGRCPHSLASLTQHACGSTKKVRSAPYSLPQTKKIQ